MLYQGAPSTLLNRLEAAMWPSFLWGLVLVLPALLVLRSRMLPRVKQLWLEAVILAWIGGTVLLAIRTPDWSWTPYGRQSWVGVFWTVGAVVSLGVWIATLVTALAKVRLAKMRGLPVAGWVREESARLGLASPPEVRILPDAKGLLVACVGNTVLVSPDFPGDLDEDQARAVLRHELGHVAGSHWLRWMMISGLQSLVFWHPAGWWLCQQLQIEREMECDDIAREGARLPYAEALLRIGKTRQSMFHLSLGGLAATRRWKRLPDPLVAPSRSDSIRTQLTVAGVFGLSILAALPIFSGRQDVPAALAEKSQVPMRVIVTGVKPRMGFLRTEGRASGSASSTVSGYSYSVTSSR